MFLLMETLLEPVQGLILISSHGIHQQVLPEVQFLILLNLPIIQVRSKETFCTLTELTLLHFHLEQELFSMVIKQHLENPLTF